MARGTVGVSPGPVPCQVMFMQQVLKGVLGCLVFLFFPFCLFCFAFLLFSSSFPFPLLYFTAQIFSLSQLPGRWGVEFGLAA